jgi:hypothetical protein
VSKYEVTIHLKNRQGVKFVMESFATNGSALIKALLHQDDEEYINVSTVDGISYTIMKKEVEYIQVHKVREDGSNEE